MKKSILLIIIFILIGGLIYYFASDKNNFSKQHKDLQNQIGSSKIAFTDPVNNREVNLQFAQKLAQDKFDDKTTTYKISDLLLPVNIDEEEDLEYPFLLQAEYDKDTNITLLAIANFENDQFVVKDIVKVGNTNQIDELHPYKKELVIDAYIGSGDNKESVKLTYTFKKDEIVPGKNNIDLNTEPNKPEPTPTPTNTPTPQPTQQSQDDTSGKIALTFDDGPGTFTPNVLSALSDKGVIATFFMIGENVDKHSDFAKQVKDAGHVIGNHTYTHPDLTKLSYDGQKAEITKTTNSIHNAVGNTDVHYLRPPYGNHDDNTAQVLSDLGMELMLWNVDTRDWSGISADEIYNAAIAGAKDGAIILMHDGVNNSSETAKAVPRIIDELRNQGYNLVTIPELYN